MRRLEVSLQVDAPASAARDVLVDLDRWPDWGPSVRGAELHDGGRRLRAAAHGTVTTAVGLSVPFRVNRWVAGERWAWNVAGLPATSHVVRSLGPDRCEVAFGVPWFAAPYLVVCRVALTRIAELAVTA